VLTPAPSRGQLLPTRKDEIEAIFFCFQNNDESLLDSTIHPGYHAGYVIIDGPQTTSRRATLDGIPVTYVERARPDQLGD
jgi:DNA polymerase zeta